MILIYTHHITPRLSYVIDLIFTSILNTPYQITTQLESYNLSSYPKLAYTDENKGFDVFIKSDMLLFEATIKKEIPIFSNKYIEFPVFFNTSIDSFLPYDIFATVFYFATRYEEYIIQETDQHQRFIAERSLAFKNQCLNKPFLNYLAIDFAYKLKNKFSSWDFDQRSFNFISTIDIDNAFAYANKGFTRNAGGILKDMLSLNFSDIYSRIASNINSLKDPYNTFGLINEMSRDTLTSLHYFVLIGDYSAYDKNPHYKNKAFRFLIKDLSVNHAVGLHPSYQSFNHPEKIEIEKKRLEEIIERKITSARCHFLKIKFPDTYRHFINSGITDDYTMIYASQSGFRTGLCIPYKWFDLEKNQTTDLTIHPSTLMEGTLRDYNKLSPINALAQIKDLLNEVKKFGGEFVSIWHNDSFAPLQKDWIEVYKQLLMQSKT